MLIQKLKTVSLLFIIAYGFTACSAIYKDGYYSGQQPIKEDSALVFASTTAQRPLGSTLFTFIKLENQQTKKTLRLENRTCVMGHDTPGMGLIAQAVMASKDMPKDQISVNNICGSLVVGEIEAGEYEIKNIEIQSQNIAQGGYGDSIKYVPTQKQLVSINRGEIVYLGHIETTALDMRGNYTIRSANIFMNDNYEYDSTIFKQTYKIYEDSLIRDNAILLENKKL